MHVHVIYTDSGMFISKKNYDSWRQIQDENPDYKASLGPWSKTEVIDFLIHEYKLDLQYATSEITSFFESDLMVCEFKI